MLITVIDDEPLALKSTVGAVCEVFPGASVHSFLKCSELLDFASENRIDIAFLDINMRGHTGLEIAEKLKETNPTVNIIFVTGYSEHKSAAMDLHASGYLMKPVTAENISEEIKFLRYPVKDEGLVSVNCFGNFSVEINGLPVRFSYNKTKELFAYLIDRKGAAVSNGEISAVLWDDDTHKEYLKKLRSDLINTFKASGVTDVIVSGKGTLAVDKNKVRCDYYEYLESNASIQDFNGEYMSQYSWAESTLGMLMTK